MRVTLLHIANDGNAEIPRALRQECDDIVQISASQLRPFAELISGAEPPRRDERDGGMLAIRAGSNGNGHGNGNGNGHGNGRALLGRVAQHAAERHGGRPGGAPSGSPPRPTTRSPTSAASRTTGRSRSTGPARTTAPSPSDYGAPAPGAGPSLPDFTPAPAGSAGVHGPGRDARAPGRPAAGIAGIARPGRAVRGAGRRPAGRGRPDRRARARPGLRPGAGDPPPGRVRVQPVESGYNPAESGYNPGAVRDQFQLEAASREPHPGGAGDRYQPVPVPVPAAVPAGSAAIRRLPVHNGAQPGRGRASRRGQPLARSGAARPAAASRRGPAAPPTRTSGPGRRPPARDRAASPSPRSCRWSRRAMGYGGNRAAAYGGPRPVNGPVSLVGQPPVPAAHAGPAGPGDGHRPGSAGSRSAGPAGSGRSAGAGRLSRAEPGGSAAAGRAAGRGRVARAIPAGSPASPSPTRCSPRTRRARRSASRWPATRPRCGWKPCLPGSRGCRLTLRPGCFRDRPCRSTSCSMTRCGTRCAAGSGMRLSTPADKSGRMGKGR